MSLAITANIQEKQNVILPLATGSDGVAVRLAALTTDYIGQLTVTGATDRIAWTLFMAPAWLSIEVDPASVISNSNVAYVKFNNPSADRSSFNCYLQADDGNTKIKFPLCIEVVEPLTIVISGRTDNYAAYDSDARIVSFTAKGLHELPVTDGTVQFIPPSDLPKGLLYTVGDGGTASLMVRQPDSQSTSGGIVPSTPASYDFRAYRPGSMYDSPDRSIKRTITIGTLSDKQGSLSASYTCIYDDVNDYLKLNVFSDYLNGTGNPLSFAWTITGTAVGTVTSGGGPTDDFLYWTPSAAGTVQFDLTITDSLTQHVMQVSTFGPFEVGIAGLWTSGATPALKLNMASAYETGNIGETVAYTVSMNPADIDTGETITVNVVVTPVGDEYTIANPIPLVLTQAQNSASFNLVVPAGSKFKGKWNITLTASNVGSTRLGQCRAILTSTGTPHFQINNNSLIHMSQNTGSPVQPVNLIATSISNLSPVNDVVFSLVSAPAGLTIVNNQIVGSVTTPGTFSFKIMGRKPNYANSFTDVVLDVRVSETPFAILNFSSDAPAVADNTQFSMNWGTTGNAKELNLQRNADLPKNVVNTVRSIQTITGTSVFSLIGTDYIGKVYTKPILVTSSSTAGLTKLPVAPTIAVINQNDLLSINWTPEAVNDSYEFYRGWNIQTKKNGASPVQLLTATGLNPTGLDDPKATNDSRIFTQQIEYGEYALNMQALSSSLNSIQNSDAWSTFRDFPGKPDSSTIVLDKTSVKLKESLTVQLSSVYGDADYWRISYSDGTTSDWLPISTKAQSKIFSIAGQQTVTVEFEKDYSSLVPKTKLRRSLEYSVYVQNEYYNSAAIGQIGNGNIGLGGTSGFEIADESKIQFAKEPYEVVVKALVRDDITQELKLMVATSRTNNASSILNTMAADVFPLQGRPHLKDLVLPALTLTSNFNIESPVSITTTALPDVFVGKPMPEVQLQAIGGNIPYDWYSDSLPFGLKLAIDGTLSGTPLVMGVYDINFSVQDSTNPRFISETTVTMTVQSDVSISLSGMEDAQVGTAYTHQFIANGGLAPYNWYLKSGNVPLGLTLDITSGVMSGYPVTYNSDGDFDTPFRFTIEVIDSVGAVATGDFTMNLIPMILAMGSVDQPMILQGEDFKMAIPVYGGRSPYNIDSFASDGSIGNMLMILAPEAVDAVSGQGVQNLTIITGDQIFTPNAYPFQAVFPLAAAGGTAPYTWTLDQSNPVLNSIGTPTVTASQAAGEFIADGRASINVRVTDANSKSVSKTVYMTSTLNAGSGGTGTFSLEYVTINKNSSTDVRNWTFTKVGSLPDAGQGVSYQPGASTFYGIALWNPTANRMYDLRIETNQIQMKYLYSKVGGVGLGTAQPLVIVARSTQWALPVHTVAASPTYTTVANPVNGGTGVVPVVFKRTTTSSANLVDYTITDGLLATPANTGVVPGSSLPVESPIYAIGYDPGTSWNTALWNTGTNVITQALFNSNGAVDTSGTLYPAHWQAIDNDQIYITQKDLGAPVSGVWTWSIGPATTLTSGWEPKFQNLDGTVGATVTTTHGGYVRLVPSDIPTVNFQGIGIAKTNPYILEIRADDGNGNVYSAKFTYYLISGGFVTKRGTTWVDGTAVVWPDGTTIGFTSPFSKSSMGGNGGTYNYGNVLIYGNTTGVVSPPITTNATLGSSSTTPYFPMAVKYFQGDYSNKPSIQMAAGDTGAFVPLKGNAGTGVGSNPYTFVILNDTGSAPANSTIDTTGGYTIGTVATDNALSKEMHINCAVTPVGTTPVITVTSVSGDTIPWEILVNTAQIPGDYTGGAIALESYAKWYYILSAAGGTGPYTFQIEDGTTLPHVSVHNSQNSQNWVPSLPAYQGDFLLLSYSYIDWATFINRGADFTVKVSATDANGVKSSIATIPFKVYSSSTQVLPTTPQVLHNTLTGGTFYINGADVAGADQWITLSTPMTFTVNTMLPAGLALTYSGSGVLRTGDSSEVMAGPTPRVDALRTQITSKTLRLVGTPTGTAITTPIIITASLSGASPLTFTLTLTTTPKVAAINLLQASATPGTAYNYANGSSILYVHCEGYTSSRAEDRPGLVISDPTLGTLGAATITHLMTNYTNAQSFDVYYDYTPTNIGSPTLSLTNTGGAVGTTSVVINNGYPSLQATGLSITHSVSEYMSTPFTVSTPPVNVSGGVAPYKVSAISVSDSAHFYIQNEQFFMNMSAVKGGNTYETQISYRVVDASGQTLLVKTPAIVKVQVLAENYVTADFINKTISVPNSFSTVINAIDLIKVQLGHPAFQVFVDTINYSNPSVKVWVSESPSTRRLIINRTISGLGYTDYADNNTIPVKLGGGGSIIQYKTVDLNGSSTTPTGGVFTVTPTGAITPGTYTLTLGLRVVDSLGYSTSGTSVVTLNVL